MQNLWHEAALICFRIMLFFHNPEYSNDFVVHCYMQCIVFTLDWKYRMNNMFEQMSVNPCVWGFCSGVMLEKITVWTLHLFSLKLQQIYFFHNYLFYIDKRNSLIWDDLQYQDWYLITSEYFQIFVCLCVCVYSDIASKLQD